MGGDQAFKADPWYGTMLGAKRSAGCRTAGESH